MLRVKGDLARAKDLYMEALKIQQKFAPESIVMADMFYRLCVLSNQTGNMNEAEDFARKALALQQKLVPNTRPVALTLSELGQLQTDKGDSAEAENSLRKAIAIERELAPESIELGSYLSGLGIAVTNRGRLAEADEIYHEALAVFEKFNPEGVQTGTTLSFIAQLEWARDDFVQAEKDFLRAANILKKINPETRYYTYCLLGLGIMRDFAGDPDGAEAYLREMLTIQLKIAPAQLFTADAFDHLAAVLLERGDLSHAEEYLLAALKIQQEQIPMGARTAQTLAFLRELEEQRGDLDKALDYGRRTLAIYQQISPEGSLTAFELSSQANIMRRTQQTESAAKLYEQSLATLDRQLDRLGGSDDLRSRFRARHLTPYFEYVDLLVKQQQVDKALEVLERYRARSLMETMASAHVDIRKDTDSALLKQESTLKADLNAKSEKRIRLVAGPHSAETLSALDKEIDNLASEYQEVEGRIRDTSPAYTSITQLRPLTARQIQETLLDENTLLLEYALGEEQSYVFAIARDSMAVFEIPSRKKVEKLARNVYQLLTSVNLTYVNSDAKVNPKTHQQPDQAKAKFIEAATELSTMVLGPVSALLKNKRIAVVADGALQYIPFTALPDPNTARSKFTGGQPLVINHEVIDLPSASVLSVLRRQEQTRDPAPRTIAVLADPVFDKLDSRVIARNSDPKPAASAPINLESTKSLFRSATDVGIERGGQDVLPRLLFSRKEADAILAFVPKDTGRELLDFSASRAAATSPELSKYRIIHFATHGLVDSDHPELSGLVLSMVDERGEPQNGFLQLQDIYNLNLPADLVVLSACETALGKDISGEGLIGLTRGFMYAGASRVVASLWKVSDVATAKLMAEFYRAMEKDGMPASAALRAAQIKMWKQQRWHDPYYWAAFQIQGEWN